VPGPKHNNQRGPHYAAPPPLRLPFQAKFVVGRPNDPYEREADTVADRVVGGGNAPAVSRVATQPLSQRQVEPEAQMMTIRRQPEEEAVQAQEEEPLQQQAEEEALQPQTEETEPIQAQEEEPLQQQSEEEAVQPQEEEPVQAQEEEPLQAQEEEPLQQQGEEEPVQSQEEEPVQPDGGNQAKVSSTTAATIRSPGAGQSLPTGVRRRIEPQLGANLSNVRVHTDASAARAAGSLHARAFTHRNHIFLNRTESSSNLRLMAHEATHVVQQGSALALRPSPMISPTTTALQADFLSDIGSALNRYARYIPGFTLFTVLIEYNPLTGERVERNAMNLVQGLMELVPFGAYIFDTLRDNGVLNDAFDYVAGELNRFGLTRSRFERTLSAAADEILSITGVFNAPQILEDQFGGLYRDVRAFASSLVDHIIELIKETAIDLADDLLAENRAWSLIKKILGTDPLRDEEVEATPPEILEDFLLLIGKEQELEEMRKRGTLEKTANWLATQISTFFSLLGELRGLFEAAWDMIRPQNLPNFASNLESLAQRAGSFLQRVWDFATTVAAKVLELIKEALLNWLKSFATDIPGYHLLTVILERDIFTQEPVPRTPTNLIRGFMSLLPGGEQQFQQMSETGVIPEAAARIETLMSTLGISWPFVRDLFLGIWQSLTIEDLIDPIGAFRRITDQFGEPISRLFTFVTEVIKIVIELILQIMNFPLDIIQRIIANAMQAFEDIKRDPVQFLKNLLATLKLGFTKFFDNILQHLLSGVTEWLFGQVRKAGIEPPSEITLSSMLNLALQILGISMERIWQKLAERIGQENVDRIRGAIDRLTGIWNFIRDVQERGLVAIWEYIESQISNLFDMIMEQARNWIVTRVIERVVARLLSMLDPTGIMAVVNSFMAFFNAVQSAIEYLREILLIIDDYVSTIAAVARGDIEPGAVRLEQALANAIPVAIGFLANQVGLGNLADKLAEIIAGVRQTIDRALDWLVDRAVRLGQALLRTLGLGREDETQAIPEDEGVNIHSEFDLGTEEHEVNNRGNSYELTMTSSTPTQLDQHPSQEVKDAYATYLQAIRNATSLTGRKRAANQHLRTIVAKIKKHGNAAAPGASVPGIGTIAPHSMQQSRLYRGGIEVWKLESEHVIPRGFVSATFEALGQAGVPAGRADYNRMHTVLIYKGAADRKTEGSSGDASLINSYKSTIREIAQVVFGTRQSDPARAREEMAGASLRLLTDFASDAKGRTNEAIVAENQVNGAARGPQGNPEPPVPTSGQVDSAYSRQSDDIRDQLQTRINDFMAARQANSGS
jgi:hypothetical protein